MEIREAFKQLNRHIWIVIYPVILDLASLLAGWSLAGFTGSSRFSCRILLEMGMPSVSHLINTPLLANQLEFLNRKGNPPYAWVFVILLLLVSAFAQGGFISTLKHITAKEMNSFRKFLNDGRKYWMRFIWLFVMVMLAKVAVTALLALLFGAVGLFASFAVFVVMRIWFIYLEFTMVVDNMNIDTAFRQSRQYFRMSAPQTAVLIGMMYLVSSTLSILIHWFWLPFSIIAGVFVYAYLMTAVQLAFMMNLCRTREEDFPQMAS